MANGRMNWGYLWSEKGIQAMEGNAHPQLGIALSLSDGLRSVFAYNGGRQDRRRSAGQMTPSIKRRRGMLIQAWRHMRIAVREKFKGKFQKTIDIH